MIVITNVDFLEVNEDKLYEVSRPGGFVPLLYNGRPEARNAAEVREMTRGRRFTRPSDGLTVVIASTREAQSILGMQYEAWENLERAIQAERSLVVDLSRDIHRVKHASLWSRIKWVFTGVK